MKEYVLLFRMDITTESAQPDEAQMNSYMMSWMKWINSISAKEQIADGGNYFSKVAALSIFKYSTNKG